MPNAIAKRVKNVVSPPPCVPVLRLSGVIGGGRGGVRGGGLSIAQLAQPLEQAFSMRNAKAVALIINSPGGSPVQSSFIFKRIRSLADEKGLPVYAFAEDVAASGGYLIACAADEIYADESSILGSIGVVSAGFGFVELIEKLGIERRVHTAGESKSMLDPFRPEKKDDVRRLKELQTDVHDWFKDLVRSRRGEKLDATREDLFTGAFWGGQKAVEIGLADEIGEVRSVLRAKFGDEVRLRLVAPQQPFWMRNSGGVFGGQASLGIAAEDWIQAAEQRSLWSRFGL